MRPHDEVKQNEIRFSYFDFLRVWLYTSTYYLYYLLHTHNRGDAVHNVLYTILTRVYLWYIAFTYHSPTNQFSVYFLDFFLFFNPIASKCMCFMYVRARRTPHKSI